VKIATPGRLIGAGIALLVVIALLGWLVPSGYYLYVPNRAEPLAPKVKVEGERDDTGPGGIYYVDIVVRRATWPERLLPFLRPDGATMVPEHAVVPPGSSFAERRQDAQAEMARSEDVAAAVALREAGYPVQAAPRGVLVEGVASDAPAVRVLRPQDVIVAVDGRPVRTPAQLRAAVGRRKPGDVVGLTVRRDGKRRQLTVRTVPDPADPKRPLIGIRVGQAAQIELPIDVDIDLGNVGGPSAGLAFALDVLEELGRDVDRGHKVAATGEIELDGSVRPIGGVKQKAFGVRKANADVFLVPAGDNAEEARRYAGKARVIPVENFQQALQALATLPQRS
jgi:PDZ domain-containing protein